MEWTPVLAGKKLQSGRQGRQSHLMTLGELLNLVDHWLLCVKGKSWIQRSLLLLPSLSSYKCPFEITLEEGEFISCHAFMALCIHSTVLSFNKYLCMCHILCKPWKINKCVRQSCCAQDYPEWRNCFLILDISLSKSLFLIYRCSFRTLW